MKGNGPAVVRSGVAPGSVYMLGAGFSRAVFGAMPLTDELGARVLARLGEGWLQAGTVFEAGGLTFESWLSWLGETQPFDSVSSGLQRRARFVQLQTAIAEEIVQAQESVLEMRPPWWLYALIQLFHLGRSSVVTFNYDEILERAIPLQLADAEGEYVRAEDVVVPFFSETGTLFATSQAAPRDVDSFDYLKLHGSADWWMFPDDATGASLQRGRPRGALSRARRRLRGLRQPFIVPPTSQKSGFYASALTHFLWTEAAEALGSASEIALVGYSMPLTDGAIASLLSERVAPAGMPVTVVDLDPEPVVGRLAAVGCGPDRVDCFGGRDGVESFVRDRGERAARGFAVWFVDRVGVAEHLAFGWSLEQRAAVTRAWLEDDGRTLVLQGAAVSAERLARSDVVLPEGDTATRAMPRQALPPVGDVQRVLLEAEGRRWSAVGEVRQVVAPGMDGVGDEGGWMVLYPFGPPPGWRGAAPA